MPAADGTGVPAGAVYNGDGRLLLGSGPAFSLGLITDRAFQAALHNLDEPGNTIEPEERLWLLPEGLIPGAPLPEYVLAGLALVVRAGCKVVAMADGAEAGNWACEAID